MPPPVDLALERAIRRNTVILGSTFAIGWAVIQLQSALTAITTEVLTGETAVAGVGSALFLVALGLVAVPAGRFMDRVGRGAGLSPLLPPPPPAPGGPLPARGYPPSP